MSNNCYSYSEDADDFEAPKRRTLSEPLVYPGDEENEEIFVEELRKLASQLSIDDPKKLLEAGFSNTLIKKLFELDILAEEEYTKNGTLNNIC